MNMGMGLCVGMYTGFLTPVEARGVSCPGTAGAEGTGSCESHYICSGNQTLAFFHSKVHS